jgi:putative nucleotidyltransferase with HDIG domain
MHDLSTGWSTRGSSAADASSARGVDPLSALRRLVGAAGQRVEERFELRPSLLLLIAGLDLLAAAVSVVFHDGLVQAAHQDVAGLSAFVLLTVALQVLSIEMHGSGGEAVSVVGILAAGFLFGPGVAVAVAVVAAVAQWIRKRGLVHRALFDAANFALSAGAAAVLYGRLSQLTPATAALAEDATVAGIVYKAINSGLLCLAMSLDEQRSPRAVWNERFHWARFHYLAFGPLALASALGYQRMHFLGLIAFALPPTLVSISVRQYLERTRASVEEVQRVNRELAQANSELKLGAERIRQTHLATIAALSRSIEASDRYTGDHTDRVAAIATAIAARLGMDGADLEAIEIAALLHDIGKIGIPENILHKPGRLDDAEWEIMKTHTVIGEQILREVDLHPFVRQVARSSHERFDGNGYPDRLSGDEIPLAARIVLVADAFDALTSDRPYRPGRSAQAALTELESNVGTQFCPRVFEAFEEVVGEHPEWTLRGVSAAA